MDSSTGSDLQLLREELRREREHRQCLEELYRQIISYMKKENQRLEQVKGGLLVRQGLNESRKEEPRRREEKWAERDRLHVSPDNTQGTYLGLDNYNKPPEETRQRDAMNSTSRVAHEGIVGGLNTGIRAREGKPESVWFEPEENRVADRPAIGLASRPQNFAGGGDTHVSSLEDGSTNQPTPVVEQIVRSLASSRQSALVGDFPSYRTINPTKINHEAKHNTTSITSRTICLLEGGENLQGKRKRREIKAEESEKGEIGRKKGKECGVVKTGKRCRRKRRKWRKDTRNWKPGTGRLSQ
jgi:hypothetical protein